MALVLKVSAFGLRLGQLVLKVTALVPSPIVVCLCGHTNTSFRLCHQA